MSDETRPAASFGAVTPSNSVNLTTEARALYVGGDGDVAAVGPDDGVATFVGVVAGTVLPIKVKRVNSTNTTATNIVALY
jgi:hypothetical protein